jgi:hypothetical protein
MPRKTAPLRFEAFPRKAMPESGAKKKGDVLKAFVVSAVVAAGITILSAPVGDVVARPLPSFTADTITTCKQHPWPYLNCVGTEFGIRAGDPVSTAALLISRFGARLS